jgi:hypothetical protein
MKPLIVLLILAWVGQGDGLLDVLVRLGAVVWMASLWAFWKEEWK